MTECTVCLQKLRPPVRVLPCGHSFCSSCLRQVRSQFGVYNVDDGTVSVNCPNCRQEARLQNGKVSTLPTNFALNDLLESDTVVASAAPVIHDENLQSDQCSQQVVPPPPVAIEPDETSSAFYARIRAAALSDEEEEDVSQSVHENLSTEASSHDSVQQEEGSLPPRAVSRRRIYLADELSAQSAPTYSDAVYHESFVDELGIRHYCRTCRAYARRVEQERHQRDNVTDVVTTVTEVEDSSSTGDSSSGNNAEESEVERSSASSSDNNKTSVTTGHLSTVTSLESVTTTSSEVTGSSVTDDGSAVTISPRSSEQSTESY